MTPLYAYRCDSCGRSFERLNRLANRESTAPCENCGETASAIPTTFSFRVSSRSERDMPPDNGEDVDATTAEPMVSDEKSGRGLIEHVYISGNHGPGLIVSDNEADLAQGGGGGFVTSGPVDLKHVVLENNQGGILSRNATLNMSNLVFKGNDGEAVDADGGEIDAQDIIVE